MAVVVKKINSGNVIELAPKELVSAITEYQEQGFHVLPLDSDNVCHKTKEQQEGYVIESIQKDFAGKGVGVHLEKSQLAGIDIDCVEAVPFLETCLPQTATTYRKSKATSWMFFKLEGEIGTGISFKNCDDEGKPSHELGGIKFKAVTPLPPTIHAKTQESLEWKSKELATITAKQLIETASRCFSLALITQRWPNAGNRHEAGLAFAGALVHAGWNLENAQKAVRELAKATNDNKVEDRLNELKSTYEAHNASKEVTGLSTLVSLLSNSSNEQAYLKKTLYAWLRGNPYPDKEPETFPQQLKPLKEYVLTCSELCNLKIPPQQYIIHNWLPVEGLVNLFAKRGVGKSWFCLELAIRIAKGQDFFDWMVPKPCKVLYVDGESSLNMLVDRVKLLIGNGKIPDNNLTFIPVSDMRKGGIRLNINNRTYQDWMNEYLYPLEALGNQPDLIILDNLSALMRGIDENSNSDLDNFLDWLLELTSRRYSVLFVSHAGKDGKNRGASRKEDLIDTALELTAKDDNEGRASFEIFVDKQRRDKKLNPYKITVKLIEDEEGHLVWESGKVKELQLYEKCLIAMRQHNPKTQKELSEKMGCVPSNLTDPLKIAFDKGLLTKKPLALTPKGKAHIQPLIEALDELEAQI